MMSAEPEPPRVGAAASDRGANRFDVRGIADADVEAYLALLASRASAEGEAPVRPVRRCTAADGTAFRYVAFGGDAVVVSCEPAGEEIDVPAFVDGLRVRAVGADAFSGLLGVVRISLPDDAVDIGRHAFAGCFSLRSLSFARNGDKFDRMWVQGCGHLERLALPGRLPAVNSGELDIPPLRELVIGAGTASVANLAFSKCELDRIEVDPANPVLSSDGRALFDEGGARLVACAIRSDRFAVPAGVRAIGEKAFAYDKALVRVDFPEGLESIGDYAFFESGLESCELPSSARRVGTKAFAQCHALSRITLNEGLETIGAEAFARTPVDRLVLPSTLRDIGSDFAVGCPIVATGPAPTLSIAPGEGRFFLDGDGGLYAREADGFVLAALVGDAADYAVLAGTVAIAPHAARRNTRVRSVACPEGLREIGDAAFSSCTNLRRIALPTTLESIGHSAFEGTVLEGIEIPARLAHLGVLALSTRGGMREDAAPTLRRVSVAPGNARFFVESDVLCERLDDGRVQAVLYAGEGPVAVVPRAASIVGPCAYYGVSGIRELRIHDGIRFVDMRGLALDCVPQIVRIDFSAPVAGRPCVEVRFPDTGRARLSVAQALCGPRLDVHVICATCDAAMLRFGTLFERGVSAVERLADPLFLELGHRELYDDLLRRRLGDVCAAFADRDFASGFDMLAELGYIDAQTIAGVIDAVSASGNATMTGHLLELKRRRFGGARRDLEL